MYLRWRTDESVSNLMRTVKARSSKWIHETFPPLHTFAWQEGYSVFSVSKSQEPAVKKYIAGQAAHHRSTSPSTGSIVDTMAMVSAISAPRARGAIACRLAKLAARMCIR